MAEESQPAKPVFSGKTQIVVASIGAIGTISGALIAANWGRSREPVTLPTAVPTQQGTTLDRRTSGPINGPLVFPGTQPQSGSGQNPPLQPQQPSGDGSVMGDWRMADGTVTRVQENDDGAIEVNSQLQTPNGTAMYAGQGETQGGYLRWNYRSNTADSGQCIVQLYVDNSRMQGYCQHYPAGNIAPIVLMR